MDFMATGFGAALVVALVTGKAYFRGVVERDEDRSRYWQIVGCYALLALSSWLAPALVGALGRVAPSGGGCVPGAEADEVDAFALEDDQRVFRRSGTGPAHSSRPMSGGSPSCLRRRTGIRRSRGRSRRFGRLFRQ